MATIKVIWGPFLKLGERWTPSRINQIFEGSSFALDGAISEAQKPAAGIDGSWLSPNFILGLDTIISLEGPDWLMVHDTTANTINKVSVTNLLALGLGSALAVTTLTESDEFNVLVGGASKKIALPNVRTALHSAPLFLNSVAGATRLELLADRLSIFDASAAAAKKITPADLVRSVTDRVVVTSGSNAFGVTSECAIPALVTGLRLIVKFHQAVLTGATLAVDGLAAKPLRSADDGAIESGALAGGRIVEIIYDSAAGGLAGGWLVQGLSSGGGASLRLDGTVATNDSAIQCGCDGAGLFTQAAAHGFATGTVMWFNISFVPPGGAWKGEWPYYVIVVSPTSFKLAATKALALAGTSLPTTASSGRYYYRWNSNPIVRSSNIDGVVKHSAGYYYIDFTNDLPNANYLVQLTSENAAAAGGHAVVAWVESSGPNGGGQFRSAGGFDALCSNFSNPADTPGLCVIVTP